MNANQPYQPPSYGPPPAERRNRSHHDGLLAETIKAYVFVAGFVGVVFLIFALAVLVIELVRKVTA